MERDRSLETVLRRVSLRMASSFELDGVLAEMTRGLVRDLDAAMARVWLLDASGATPETLKLVASAGLSERLDGSHARVSVDGSGSLKIGDIARTRTRFCTNDIAESDRFSNKEWIRSNALQSFAGYPLLFGDELLGVFAVFGRRPFTELDLEHFEIFALQASIAIKKTVLLATARVASQRLEAENAYLRDEHERGVRHIVGASPAIARAKGEVDQVAATTSTVLLRGETGTGKELFAHAIHASSTRSRGAMIEVNCAAIAPTLLESELFGHERGAFTGATQRRIGRFELADGGTLFLDEIGELPLEAQAKLLRVLQEHSFERVGGTKTLRVDVRIVAATNRDLEALVKDGRFRADLFYRLAVFTITVPPLRDRREDIPELARELVRSLAARHGSLVDGIDDDALFALQAYDWPGNVRELQNVLERAVIIAPRKARGRVLSRADLPELVNPPVEIPTANDLGVPAEAPLKERVDAYEKRLIAEALTAASNNQSEAARRLGMSRGALQYKMKLFRL